MYERADEVDAALEWDLGGPGEATLLAWPVEGASATEK